MHANHREEIKEVKPKNKQDKTIKKEKIEFEEIEIKQTDPVKTTKIRNKNNSKKYFCFL